MKTIYGVSILTGTIIGAGLFSLPYIASVVGIKIMLFYLLALGGVSFLVQYFLGEISLQTPDFIRLPGFAKKYLGPSAEKLAYFSGISGMIGAILAYIILGGEFLTTLLSPFLGGENILYTTIFFLFSSFFIYFGIKAISKVELLGIILLVGILFLTFFKGIGEITISNIFFFNSSSFDIFLPYGVVLFALWGAALIPEIEEMLGTKEDKKKLLKIIPIGVVLSLFISIFFTILVLGITGEGTTKDAIVGLQSYFQNGMISLLLIFGMLVIFTSLVSVGLTVKKILWYDLKLSEKGAWAISCFVPFFLFLAGLKDFISVIGFLGGVMLAIDAILILMMYKKIKGKKVVFLTYPLILLFVLGIIYEVVYFLK